MPSHPLAGTEHSGPSAGFESLFDERYWIILPLDADEADIVRFESFITGLGSVTERMSPDYHDKVLVHVHIFTGNRANEFRSGHKDSAGWTKK